eukprot:CAMPEP_0172450776 /NCGR_PEP_ID=MMETSP1065-20121228/9001_1 /TAXON_ID=265537 /ORGANISM="Amphiprora paludosa, Strain CCMP125" /LENGTH=463 /DNA_ID=CAMNT_0013202601 /DNA_START=196 /DNA_END=1587 /DNA_ORIENTATION=+
MASSLDPSTVADMEDSHLQSTTPTASDDNTTNTEGDPKTSSPSLTLSAKNETLEDETANEPDERETALKNEQDDATHIPRRVLPCIILSQFAGTSLWFAGNAVQSDFADEFNLPDSSLSVLTSAVQAGFITGTLIFAIFNVADRFLPTRVFCLSTLVGALVNALIPVLAHDLAGMVILRFATGLALAGVYPVGMKVASDWYRAGLGRALGLLVGALVLGTAFPFLLKLIPQPWEFLLYETSILAATGGLVMVYWVPNGPFRQAASQFQPRAVLELFQSPDFSVAARGYWGHMFELYAFWAWCPVVWEAYLERNEVEWDESLVTFFVIATGALGCAVGGCLSPRFGSGRVALFSLTASGSCCLLSPAFYYNPVTTITLLFYLIWGATVAADSPQFSALVAAAAPPEKRGTALTLVNSIGFAITIASIQLLGVPISEAYLFLLLAPGPILSVYAMRGFFVSKTGK